MESGPGQAQQQHVQEQEPARVREEDEEGLSSSSNATPAEASPSPWPLSKAERLQLQLQRRAAQASTCTGTRGAAPAEASPPPRPLSKAERLQLQRRAAQASSSTRAPSAAPAEELSDYVILAKFVKIIEDLGVVHPISTGHAIEHYEDPLYEPYVGARTLPENVMRIPVAYSKFRSVLGDGDCFCRSFTFSYLEQVLDRQDTVEEERPLDAVERVAMRRAQLGWTSGFSKGHKVSGSCLDVLAQRRVSTANSWAERRLQPERLVLSACHSSREMTDHVEMTALTTALGVPLTVEQLIQGPAQDIYTGLELTYVTLLFTGNHSTSCTGAYLVRVRVNIVPGEKFLLMRAQVNRFCWVQVELALPMNVSVANLVMGWRIR